MPSGGVWRHSPRRDKSRSSLLIGVEDPEDASPDGVGAGVGHQDEVAVVRIHGHIQPTKHRGVEAEPRGIRWWMKHVRCT
jgi:hypothetical protein